MVRITVEKTQGYVDKSLDEVRHGTGIHVEEITVEETRFIGEESETIMRTKEGKIFVDPQKDYSPEDVCSEISVLHELGHRTQHVLNPRMFEQSLEKLGCKSEWENSLRRLYNCLKLSFTKRISIPFILSEGVAECFALDVFPEFCSVSEDGKESIEREKVEHFKNGKYFILARTAMGYNFFHEIYSRYGQDGVTSYVSNFSQYDIPTKKELLKPSLFSEAWCP